METLLTAEASRLGFGRGEIAAGLSNFRSIANILAPLLFAAAYNWGITPPRHFPKMIFVSRMVIGAVLPELTFRMVPLKVRRPPTQRLARPVLCRFAERRSLPGGQERLRMVKQSEKALAR